MKRLLILSTLTLATVAAKSQQPDIATIMVHYKFTHVRDTNNRNTPYTENMVLFVGKSAAAYRSYDRQVQNQLFKKQVQAQFANSPDGNFNISRHVTGSAVVYFQFPNEQKLIRQEQMFGTYIVDDQLPKLDWKITGDTASFGELHCQKATTHFKGRDYIAWFCPDLPVRVGPWKLSGLPGVIVDAHDTKNDVVFKFDGVEKVAASTEKADQGPAPSYASDRRYMSIMEDLSEDPAMIQVPTRGTKITESEFAHLQDVLHKDPDAFARMLNAQHAGDNPGGPPPDHMRIKVGPQPVINNPIELPEK